MMALIPAAIVLITMNNAPRSSVEPTTAVEWRAEVVPGSAEGEAAVEWRAEVTPGSAESEAAAVTSLLRTLNARTNADRRWAQTLQTVFVVPGPHSPAESLVQITEDMVVMCRILDKAIAPVLTPSDTAGAVDLFNGQSPYSRSQTQGLYLDGYGALFFVEVGFPLTRPPQEQEQPDAQQPGDAVWSQTVDELKGVPPRQSGPRVPAYDAQQVENLRTALVKSLRHAANVRVHGAQDRIALVVTTRCQSGSSAYVGRGFRPTGRVEQAGSMSSDVLVLGTTKVDVDAFAKGDLTLEQFTQKVSTLRSWTGSAQQPTTSTGIVLPSSGTSTITP
ncbi:MAG: hypothetical protein ABFD90_18720 [Phycisphaerales bacterium]